VSRIRMQEIAVKAGVSLATVLQDYSFSPPGENRDS